MNYEGCHDEFFDENEDSDLDDEEPYYANPDDKIKSPRITGLTCISLVHTYVQTLPHDRFTKLIPFYEYEERDFQSGREKLFAGFSGGSSTKGNVVCTLHMPHLTPYREPIQGMYVRVLPRFLD